MGDTKIIVLDDDPTGSQTVHGCLLLMRWDPATLEEALGDPAPLFFVLTNTRGMDDVQATRIMREVCRNLKQALANLERAGRQFNTLLVSRSDSTLRGHYPLETDVIAEDLGPFDAHFLVPAFFEGGRFTRGSVHYLMVNGCATPVHETEFARDSVFGYTTSYLPEYVEEKTKGRVRASDVHRFLLADVRGNSLDRLLHLYGNACCVVDAETQTDLDRFARQLREAAARGKRFLFRSGASLLTSLARLPAQPVVAEHMAEYVRAGRPGAVIVGSHVKKTTEQLQYLLEEADVVPIEVDVERVETTRAMLLTDIVHHVDAAHAKGQTPVIFTSRVERTFTDQKTRLAFGAAVSAFLMDIVRRLPPTLGFLVSKGGITSNDVLSDALALRTARLLGQILPGCSVVRCPHDHDRYPDMPVVIFPGNVGEAQALATVYRRLRGTAAVGDNKQRSV